MEASLSILSFITSSIELCDEELVCEEVEEITGKVSMYFDFNEARSIVDVDAGIFSCFIFGLAVAAPAAVNFAFRCLFRLLLSSASSLVFKFADFWNVDKVGSSFISFRLHFSDRFSHLKQLDPLLI